MATTFPYFLSDVTEELHHLRRNWVWMVVLGAVLMLVGVAAIAFPGLATLATVKVVGVCLLIAGGGEIASGVFARRWGGFFLHLLCGLLYLFFGVILLDRPGLAAVGYTLVLAFFFIAAGAARLVFALGNRFHGWGWAALSGAVTLLLGVLIWDELPEAAYWVIGTFVGIDLLFNGLSWVMLGLAVHSIPAGHAPAAGEPVLTRV